MDEEGEGMSMVCSKFESWANLTDFSGFFVWSTSWAAMLFEKSQDMSSLKLVFVLVFLCVFLSCERFGSKDVMDQ